MVIVDDHLALLAVAGQRLEFDAPGPVATTFQLHLARSPTPAALAACPEHSLTRRLLFGESSLLPPTGSWSSTPGRARPTP